MNIRELKEIIKDLPDDMEINVVYHCYLSEGYSSRSIHDYHITDSNQKVLLLITTNVKID